METRKRQRINQLEDEGQANSDQKNEGANQEESGNDDDDWWLAGSYALNFDVDEESDKAAALPRVPETRQCWVDNCRFGALEHDDRCYEPNPGPEH